VEATWQIVKQKGRCACHRSPKFVVLGTLEGEPKSPTRRPRSRCEDRAPFDTRWRMRREHIEPRGRSCVRSRFGVRRQAQHDGALAFPCQPGMPTKAESRCACLSSPKPPTSGGWLSRAYSTSASWRRRLPGFHCGGAVGAFVCRRARNRTSCDVRILS
jgi:hypothetical protein